MAELSRAALKALADAQVEDNVSKGISPQDIRDILKHIADSAYIKDDESIISASLIDMQVFISSGTYTKSVGANKAIMFVTGGGGGSSSTAGNGGGGAGATALHFADVSAVTSEVVTIGAAGTSGGGNGGTSSVGTLAIAGGGVGNSGGASGTDGGTASVGTILIPGGAGGDGDVSEGIGGASGASFWGGDAAFGSGSAGEEGAGNGGIAVIFEFG